MRITTVNLPEELTDRIDEVARASERSRSYTVRKLLESALTGADRQAALDAIAAQGLEDYAENGRRERAPNPSEVIAAASTAGQRMLDAHRKIAKGAK
jgi:predicted transcriptional regulator